MTRARSVLLVLAVVLFTLALGVALGGGPLQAQVRGALQNKAEDSGNARSRAADLTRRNRTLAQSAQYEQAFSDAVSPRLLVGQLANRGVVVLSMPGVAPATTEAVVDDVATAGGSVTSALQVEGELVDPTARALVDELSSRLVPEVDGLDIPADATVYERVGTVLSRALLTTEDTGETLDDAGRSVFNSFTTARLLSGPEPQQRASLAVVLVPEAGPRSSMTSARGTILSEMVTAMDQGSDGVVVAGPPASADPSGLVGAVRAAPAASETVSTVDTVTLRAGQIVTVLALAEQAGGTARHYGVAPSADAVMPGQAGAVAE